jgi:hypothetical protein
MPIRYKVIKAHSRVSAIINGNSRYALKYEPGITVIAPEGTLGVMVFKTKTQAKEFADHLNFFSDSCSTPDRYKVIDVTTYGRGKFIDEMAYDYSTQGLCDFYNDSVETCHFMSTARPPEGTMCYPGVTPLE